MPSRTHTGRPVSFFAVAESSGDEGIVATNSPDPTQRSRWSLPCQRFTFLQTRSTIENADSITLVLAIVFRNFIGTWRRCTVSVSSIPSPKLRAASNEVRNKCRTDLGWIVDKIRTSQPRSGRANLSRKA
jgi:hypothetical protein